LSAILFVVAYNMGEWREIGAILRSSRADRVVWVATFALTVFADLTVAVQVGVVLAAMLYIRQVTETTSVEPVTAKYIRDGQPHILQDKIIPPYVTILRIHGPFLFGATNKLEAAMTDAGRLAPVVILRLRNMTALDGTGLHALETFAQQIQRAGHSLVVCGARRQPRRLIRRSHLLRILGPENVVPHIEAALLRARTIAEGFEGVGEHLAEELSGKPM
jgi:SulP family sulfate permease